MANTNVASRYKTWMTDGEDVTCNPDENALAAEISFTEAFHFTWLRIVVYKRSRSFLCCV